MQTISSMGLLDVGGCETAAPLSVVEAQRIAATAPALSNASYKTHLPRSATALTAPPPRTPPRRGGRKRRDHTEGRQLITETQARGHLEDGHYYYLDKSGNTVCIDSGERACKNSARAMRDGIALTADNFASVIDTREIRAAGTWSIR